MNNLVLFTNTYPYGTGETFLHDEIPYLSAGFNRVIIYPLYIPKEEALQDKLKNRCSSFSNIIVKDPLLPFDHKDKKGLLLKGLSTIPKWWQIREFFSKRCFLSGKRLKLFFNYYCICNSVMSNKRAIASIAKDLEESSIAYFYWGDKSALIIPTIKQKISRVPKFVVRFHGSDIYEEVKGYLPFRKHLLPEIDYAVTISENGAEYLKKRYPEFLPKNICTYRLGSICKEVINTAGTNETFRLVSCSNVIPLKRVELIARALLMLESNSMFINELRQNGYNGISWCHMGDGPMLNDVKELAQRGGSIFSYNFTGRVEHSKVLEYYYKNNCDLFVQVSTSEGIPVSIMEALSYRIPVAATAVGGVSEIISDKSDHPAGRLLNANLTAQTLAECIKEFALMPPSKLCQMKSSARLEWENNWDSTKNYKSFVDFLTSLT